MDETELKEKLADNLLFSGLGGICAMIVGLAIFGSGSMNPGPSRQPSSESSLSEFMCDLPVLD